MKPSPLSWRVLIDPPVELSEQAVGDARTKLPPRVDGDLLVLNVAPEQEDLATVIAQGFGEILVRAAPQSHPRWSLVLEQGDDVYVIESLEENN